MHKTSKDYYKILGIDKKASQEEIKKAYRKKVLKHHPDINSKDESNEDKIKEILHCHYDDLARGGYRTIPTQK